MYVSIHVTPTEVAAIYPDGEVEVFLQNRHTTITRSLSRVSNKLEIQCVNTLGVLEVSLIQRCPLLRGQINALSTGCPIERCPYSKCGG